MSVNALAVVVDEVLSVICGDIRVSIRQFIDAVAGLCMFVYVFTVYPRTVLSLEQGLMILFITDESSWSVV